MKQRLSRSAFTLVELLAALAVLAMLMVVVFGVFNQASKAWLLAENRTESFSGARMALDLIGRDLESVMVGVHTNSPVSLVASTVVQVVTFDNGTGFIPNLSGGSTAQQAGSTANPGNSAIFFATQNADSRTYTNYVDIAECGYYIAQGAGSAGLKNGYFYLMRHYNRSSDYGFDLFTNPGYAGNPGGWWSTGPGDTPVLENALQLVVSYYTNCPTCVNGTTWVSTLNPNPTVILPRAFSLQLSVIDRRYALRANQLGLGLGDIANIPNNIGAISAPSGLQQTVREGVRTFYRSIYPREGS